jgi:signal transduction histidine kinase
MPLLLGFAASPAAPRVPLADASVAALVGGLAAGPTPDAHAALAAALARDPGLALWAVCRCHQLRYSEPRTPDELAARLLDVSCSAFGEVDRSIQPLDDPGLIGRFAAMAASAVSVARRASEAADEQHRARAYLCGLLQGSGEWLLPRDTTAHGNDWLPAWLQEKGAEVGRGEAWNNPQSAIRNPQFTVEPNDARRAWLVAVPGIAQWLPALIARLQRMQSLEGEFQQTLEAEKLASLAEFAAGAGHEINNPLAVISGRAQVLIRDERDPERRHALAAINAQALRVHEMIADMMLFARPPQPNFATVSVTDIVRRVIESLRTRAAEAEIVLACDLPPEPLLIDADSTQLLVALKALCENSLDAIGHQGRIEVLLRRAADPLPSSFLTPDPRPLTPIELLVRDTGPGIPPEVRRHIFDPFYSGRSAGRGIGFGLSKCWRIITNHGGAMCVESTPGVGTVFTIRLPATSRPSDQS